MRAALHGEAEPALEPRAGIAGTHFAATIAAVHARPGAPIVVLPGAETAFLADFPSGLLTTDPDVRLLTVSAKLGLTSSTLAPSASNARARAPGGHRREIGRASCRERVSTFV